MPRTVAIVGGGVAGLVAARTLLREGDAVTVLEASDQPGGAIRPGDLDGVQIDVGAEAFAITRPETRSLIDELGLGGSVVAPRRSDAHLLLDDGLFAMPHAMLGVPTSLAASEVVSILGIEAAIQASRLDDEPLLAEDLADPTMSLGTLVRLRMGDAVVDRILAPVVGGVHAMHPDLVEADAVIPGLRAAAVEMGSLSAGAARLRAASGVPGAAIAGLRGGMSTLVAALEDDVRAAGGAIRTRTTVTALEHAESTWRVTCADGELTADALVVAIDAPAAARLLAPVPPVAAALRSIDVGDVAVVALVVESHALDADPVGSGVLVGSSHPTVRAKAMTHASAKWEWIREAYGAGRHLVRLSYGRDGRINEPIDDLVDIATSDLADITGADDITVLDARVVRWDRSLVHPAPGHRARVAGVHEAVQAIPGLAVVGSGLGGNGLAGTIATSITVTEQLADHRRGDWTP